MFNNNILLVIISTTSQSPILTCRAFKFPDCGMPNGSPININSANVKEVGFSFSYFLFKAIWILSPEYFETNLIWSFPKFPPPEYFETNLIWSFPKFPPPEYFETNLIWSLLKFSKPLRLDFPAGYRFRGNCITIAIIIIIITLRQIWILNKF